MLLDIMPNVLPHAGGIEYGMPRTQPQPLLTDGPARFVIAHDGTSDCLALLVTETFLDKLNDMFEQDRDLNTIRKPVAHANMTIQAIENLIERAQQSLQSAEGETESAELHQYLEHQEPRLLKLRQRANQLEEQCTTLKREISRSSNYAHYVLKTAMESANLLRQDKPVSLPELDDEASIQFPENRPVFPEIRHTNSPSPEDLERQAAYDDFRDCWHHLDNIQRLFHERGYLYDAELAEYQRKCIEGSCWMARSEFDRRHLEYGMRLTGALIEAEASFERAKERADAAAPGSSCHDSSYCHPKEETESKAQAIDLGTQVDPTFIEAWRANVPQSDLDEDSYILSTNESEAGLVEISDSMSARDCGEYRRAIDRWEQNCQMYREMYPQNAHDILVEDDRSMSLRRHSA